MSDDIRLKQDIDRLQERMEETAELEALKEDVAKKRALVDQRRYTNLLEQQKEDDRNQAISKNLNFGEMDEEQIAKIQNDSKEYIAAAKRRLIFIGDMFKKIIPFFRKNLILIGADTGKGKSTAAANITYQLLKQKNLVTGKYCRVLYITNEEKAEDFYNRITCLSKGWHYVDHDEFTEEQSNFFSQAIPHLARGGRLTVIDNDYKGSHGMTTSIEGIQRIFENLLKNREYYDAILIDYYQNIIESTVNPGMTPNEVQARLSNMLDHYKNVYPAPIVLFAQCDPATEDDNKPFKERIRGRKLISNPCTVTIEMVVDYNKQATQWTVWKSRFTKAIGKSIWTGFENGHFVEYNDEFQARVQRQAYEKMARETAKEMDKKNGLPDVFKGKEDDKKD